MLHKHFLLLAFILTGISGCNTVLPLPDLPIKTTQRESVLAQTSSFLQSVNKTLGGPPQQIQTVKPIVLIFDNLSDANLLGTIKVYEKNGKESGIYGFELQPHQNGKEMGVLETYGRGFEHGESIEISVDGYRTYRKQL